jgi:hypothetical protein
MPLQNIFLDQDSPGMNLTNEQRKAKWSTAPIVSEDFETSVSQQKLAREITQFVTEFVDKKWVNPTTQEPKEELGLMFTVNRRVLLEILNQTECEGIRIFMASKSILGATKTSLVLKPVNATLDELDKVRPMDLIKFSRTLTECPPETRCPSDTFDTFKIELKQFLQSQSPI